MANAKDSIQVAPEIAAKAREIEKRNGLPADIAIRVALGELTLAAALRLLLRGEKVKELMTRHSLEQILAERLVDGIYSLEWVLDRRSARQRLAREAFRSALGEAFSRGAPIVLVIDPDQVAIGKIIELGPYALQFHEDGAETPESIDKVALHFVMDPADRDAVLGSTQVDEEVRSRALSPAYSPKERHHFRHDSLERLVRMGSPCEVVTRRGVRIRGRVEWYSRYEVGLRLECGARVTIFRHAFHDLCGEFGSVHRAREKP